MPLPVMIRLIRVPAWEVVIIVLTRPWRRWNRNGNGGLWSLKSPSKNVSKPAGEWQSIYAKLVGNTVTVILNGEKIIDNFKLERPTHLYAEMKHIKHGEPGPILLQGDHKPIDYRHVMLRPIAQ